MMSAFAASLPLRPPRPLPTHCSPRRPSFRRSRRVVTACVPPERERLTPDQIRALITSQTKAEQQKGLLHIRSLPPPLAYELLLLSLEVSNNEFIRSTAALGLGQIPYHPHVTPAANNSLVHILATDADYSVRAAAAAAIAYVPREDNGLLREALCRALLEDNEWQVHFSCLASLGNLKDPKALPTLIKYLNDPNDLLVQAAVGALGDIAQNDSIPSLLNLLGSSDMMTRQRLAQALGNISASRNEPAVIDALRTLCRDQSFAVREAAEEALKGLGKEPLQQDMSETAQFEAEVMNLLQGDESGDAVGSASDALRRRLERSFDKEYISDESGVGVVADSLEKNQLYERLVTDLVYGVENQKTIAAIQLRQFSGALCLKAIADSDALNPSRSTERVRAVCVNLLAKGGDVESIIRLLRSDPDQNVRSACCDALTDVGGGDRAVTAAIEAFKTDSHWLVRVSAVIALGTIGKGYSSVDNELISALESSELSGSEPPAPVLRRHVVTALGFLGCQRAVGTFEKLVDGDDDAVRYRVAAALRGIPCAASVLLLQRLIGDGKDEVRDMAQASLDALSPLDP